MADPTSKPRTDTIAHKSSTRSRKSTHSSNRFSVVEAYKTIRTNLQFSLTKKTGNTIIITSTLPRDGKSTVVANVGVAFAQIGVKTLIIDADLRKPRMNKFFNIPAVPGLSNHLAGLAPLSEVVQSTNYPNLHVIPSGILPPNPAELIASTAMDRLVESMKEQYDVILMDTPPANIVSDAVVATKFADGVILVVRHSVTTHPDVARAIKSFELVNAKIIGLVLNAVDYSKIYGKRYGSYGKYGKYSSYGKYGAYGGYGSYGGYGNNDAASAISEKLFEATSSNGNGASASNAGPVTERNSGSTSND